MVRVVFFLLLLLVPASVAYANPTIDPFDTVGTFVVVPAALFLEIFLTTGVLIFSGMALGPTFLILIVGNIASYLGVLCPLVFYFKIHTILAEAAVIAVETTFIKLVSHLSIFQMDTFIELKWRYALLAAILGNASSYYIGTLIEPGVL